MSSYTIPILCSKTQECKNYSNKCKGCVRYSHYNILNKENKDMYKANVNHIIKIVKEPCFGCKYFMSTSKGVGSCEADDYNSVKTTDTCDIYEDFEREM